LYYIANVKYIRIAGSNPVFSSWFGEIGKHKRFKIFAHRGTGSSPVISNLRNKAAVSLLGS
jgi:hypothetical protein